MLKFDFKPNRHLTLLKLPNIIKSNLYLKPNQPYMTIYGRNYKDVLDAVNPFIIQWA